MATATSLRTEEIARQLSEYWEGIPLHDKDQLITWDLVRVIRSNKLASFPPCLTELNVRVYFDGGVSVNHNDAVSNPNGQPLPSGVHSEIVQGYPNAVYGEPDYFLVSRQTGEVKGSCEAKLPWNVDPEHIENVILGTDCSTASSL
jgi:hypothetical protein